MNNESDSIVLKRKLLKMAKIFHEFCQSNGIEYFMIGGTMLGAVRHKGFIPWDDDIDFGVPRKSYEKMLSLRDRLPEGYTFNVPSDGKNFKYGFCKMYDENTTFVESGKDTRFIGGVFIDVFPIDNIGDDYGKALKIMKSVKARKRFVSAIYQKGNRTGLIKTVVARLLQLIPENPKLFDLPYKPVKKFKDKPSEYLVNVYGAYNEREITPTEVIGTPVLYEFEDTAFYGVEDYDKYLTTVYGDYMTPPPEDKRGGHPIIYVDYDLPYKEYAKRQLTDSADGK